MKLTAEDQHFYDVMHFVAAKPESSLITTKDALDQYLETLDLPEDLQRDHKEEELQEGLLPTAY